MGRCSNLIVVAIPPDDDQYVIDRLRERIEPARTVVTHTRSAGVTAYHIHGSLDTAQIYPTGSLGDQYTAADSMPRMALALSSMISTIVLVIDEPFREKAFAKLRSNGWTVDYIQAPPRAAEVVPIHAAR